MMEFVQSTWNQLQRWGQGKYLQFTITAMMVMVTVEQLGEPASGDQHHQGAITLSQQTALHWLAVT